MSGEGGIGYDAVWINGSVGTGKSTTAAALGRLLEERGVPGALVDVDELRRCWPATGTDRFSTEIATENLRAVSRTFRAHGARVVVVAGVIEEHQDLARQREALGSQRLLLVRLVGDPRVGSLRLARRHGGDEALRDWHLRRQPELAQILERADLGEELVVDTSELSPQAVARTIAQRL